ncbi:MAG: general secretion pathway protein GspB [bacterium]|nr:general secretion pathway protein GspB [bacterium]
MSSILRALKKIDEAAVDPEKQNGEQAVNIKRVVNRRAKEFRLVYGLIAFLSVIIVGIALWMLINWKAPVTENTSRQTQQAPLQGNALKKEGGRVCDNPGKVTDSSASERKDKTPPVSPLKPGLVEPPVQSRAKRTVAKRMQGEPVSTGSPSVVPVKKNVRKAIPPGKSLLPTMISKEPLRQRSIKPTGFILKGIIWSKKPGRRQALINDRYLKEGDTIKGAEIIKIGKNSVTLRAGDKKWEIKPETKTP